MTPHSSASPYVRDQLSVRAIPLNEKRSQPEGEFVLYWMQSTQRLEENWALRYATLEADRLGRPLLIHQEIEPTYAYASDRHHTFMLEGAREIAQRASEFGYAYQLIVRRRRGDPSSVARLAARATMVVTDLLPTAGVPERTRRLVDQVNCRVVAVDSAGVVPAASFPREEYAARTIRPKIAKLLDYSLEPVEERAPRRALSDSVFASLDVDRVDIARADIAAEVARCEIDHTVRPSPIRGGLTAARARLDAFVRDGLAAYAERRRHPSDEGGSSRLSPYLHHGQIAAAEIARTVLAAGNPAAAAKFLDEMLTWRELALNFCTRNPSFHTLAALPEWTHRSMARHEDDERETIYTLEALERAETHDPLWNAGQRELVRSGQMHNVVRMLWGKTVLTWTRTYAEALAFLIHLNDKYALDGRDPNSYAGIQWCFGKFDRPFQERAVWGTIRPISLSRAYSKYDVGDYVRRWSGGWVQRSTVRGPGSKVRDLRT
jgi:deoxyribodipyrimidine photo-lyase